MASDGESVTIRGSYPNGSRSGLLALVLGGLSLFAATDIRLAAGLHPSFICLAAGLEAEPFGFLPGGGQLLVVLALGVTTLFGCLVRGPSVHFVLLVLA